jgi:hypothetical protein
VSGSRRPALATVLGGVLVLAAAGGGITWTDITVHEADRTAHTTVYEDGIATPSDAYHGPDPTVGRTDSPLAKDLLPVPIGYELGPDIEEFGNDTVLTDKEAQAVLEHGDSDLPGKQGAERRKIVRKLKVKGLGMRSYSSIGADLVVELRIAKMGNKQAVHTLSTFQAKLADALSIFRDGPKIKGHEHAKCFLLPKIDKAEIDEMFCTAYQGDKLVSMTASGSKPFPKDDAAELLKDQLDRLGKGGGMSV